MLSHLLDAPQRRVALDGGLRRGPVRRARVQRRPLRAGLGADHEPDLAAARGVRVTSITSGLACVQCMAERTVLREVGACSFERRTALGVHKVASVYSKGGPRPDDNPDARDGPSLARPRAAHAASVPQRREDMHARVALLLCGLAQHARLVRPARQAMHGK